MDRWDIHTERFQVYVTKDVCTVKMASAPGVVRNQKRTVQRIYGNIKQTLFYFADAVVSNVDANSLSHSWRKFELLA